MLASTTSKWGLNREARDALFRVRTGPECPEDNLRELTSDINPKLWDSQRERKKIKRKKERGRERELSHEKLYPKTLLGRSLNKKGLSESREELAGCRLAHHLQEAERQAGNSQSWKARGNLGPRDSIVYQSVSRLPVTNQVFLRSWTVDIHQEGHSQRSAPQRRHTAHLRWQSHWASRKPSGWEQGGDKMHHPTGESAPAKHLVA